MSDFLVLLTCFELLLFILSIGFFVFFVDDSKCSNKAKIWRSLIIYVVSGPLGYVLYGMVFVIGMFCYGISKILKKIN